MRASLSRIRALIVPITFGAAVLFSVSTESRGDDIPALQKENGPYMVMARVFRGPDAEKNAKALASELRKEHKLPTYLYEPFPKSTGQVAVLVGDAKSLKENEELLRQVRRLNPVCLADKPAGLTIFANRPRLANAYRTRNPLLPATRPPVRQH